MWWKAGKEKYQQRTKVFVSILENYMRIISLCKTAFLNKKGSIVHIYSVYGLTYPLPPSQRAIINSTAAHGCLLISSYNLYQLWVRRWEAQPGLQYLPWGVERYYIQINQT